MLLEVDFNTLHKIIFNERMIPILEVQDKIPQEITDGKQTQVAKCLALNKKLIVDTANARKRLIVTICTDIMNYYDRVVYPFSSLYMKYFRLEVTCLLVLFKMV